MQLEENKNHHPYCRRVVKELPENTILKNQPTLSTMGGMTRDITNYEQL